MVGEWGAGGMDGGQTDGHTEGRTVGGYVGTSEERAILLGNPGGWSGFAGRGEACGKGLEGVWDRWPPSGNKELSEGQVQLMGDKVEMFNWNMALGLLPSHPPQSGLPRRPPLLPQPTSALEPPRYKENARPAHAGRQRPPECL